MPPDRRDSNRAPRTRPSRPVDGDRAELDLVTRRPHRGLPHPHAHPLGPKALEQRVRDRAGQRLEQVEAALVDLPDRSGDTRVVDGIGEPVAFAPAPDLERDVVEEGLSALALLAFHSMEAVQLEPTQLDDHAKTARAAASASTCSRTSCARMIVAPRS